MEVKIDNNGILWIMRKSKFELACCPYIKTKSGLAPACWCGCALFSEPFYRNEAGMADISLCQKTLKFVHLIDERE